MKPAPRFEELDALVASARRMAPAPLPELVARRMVREATSQRLLASQPRRRPLWLLAAAALLVCGISLLRGLWPTGTVLTVGQSDPPLRVALLAGDGVTMAPGARLEVRSQSPRLRSMRLTRGAALFDVLTLRPGEAFEVTTEHTKVRVVGTVFSVEVVDGRTLVRVYEGRVRLPDRVLEAGVQYSSQPDSAKVRVDPLALHGVAAARARAALGPVRSNLGPVVDAVPSVLTPPLAPPASRPSPAAEPAPQQRAADAGSPAAPSLDHASELLAGGQALEALTLARAALAHTSERDLAWLRLKGDALHALGRFDEAIFAYERAAFLADWRERPPLAYATAALALEALHDPERALGFIERFGLDEEASPLRERASRLRVHALLALHRDVEARAAARRYVDREPETAVSEEMRRLLGW
jgi:hypothetical protein